MRQSRLERSNLPRNKVILWVMLLVIGLMAYGNYLELAPMD